MADSTSARQSDQLFNAATSSHDNLMAKNAHSFDSGSIKNDSDTSPPHGFDTSQDNEVPRLEAEHASKNDGKSVVDLSIGPIPQSDTASISFLDLPPEIRNKIYSYHFAPMKGLKAWMVGAYDWSLKAWQGGFPDWELNDRARLLKTPPLRFGPWIRGLFFSSRQVYNETKAIFYGNLTFQVISSLNLDNFLRQIGSCAKYVRRIVLRKEYVKNFARALETLSTTVSLEYLHIYVHTWKPTVEPGPIDRIDKAPKAAKMFKNFLLAQQAIKNDREAVLASLRLAHFGNCRAAEHGSPSKRCRCRKHIHRYKKWHREFKSLVFEYLVDKPAGNDLGPDKPDTSQVVTKAKKRKAVAGPEMGETETSNNKKQKTSSTA